MTNNRPMIIGTADAIALRKRMETLEAQMSALVDGMRGAQQALEGLLKGYEELEARIDLLETQPTVARIAANERKSRGQGQSEVVNG